MGLFNDNANVTTTFKGKDELSPVVRNIRSAMADFKKDAITGFGLGAGLNIFHAATRAIGAVVDVIGDSISAASDQSEAMSKVTVVFGEQSDAIKDWAKTASDSMGMSETAALQAAGTLGNLLLSMGNTEKAASDMSREMVQLAADIGSFNNVPVDEVLMAMRSGLTGEIAPLRRFGVNLTDVTLKAKAFALGLNDGREALSTSAKSAAAYHLILEQTTTAQGDFKRTADGLANSTKTFNAKMAELSVQLGKFLEGPAADFVGFLTGVAASFTPHNAAVQKGIDFINSYGEALAGATEAGAKLPAQLRADAIAAYTQAFQDYLDVNGQFLKDMDKTGQTFEMINRLNREFAFNSGQSAESLAVLAERVRLGGGDFDDFVFAIQRMIAAGIDIKAMAMRYVRSFDEMGEGTDEATRTMSRFAEHTPILMTHAVVDMKAAIKSGRTGIVEQFRLLAWQTKHPFAEVNYADWLGDRQESAMRKSRQAVKAGKGGVAAQYRALAASIRAEMQGLPGYMASIAGQVVSALSIIPGMGGLDDILGWTPPSGGGRRNRNRGDRRPGDGPPTGHSAQGGSASGTTMVGEYGPELLHLGSAKARVTPNHQMGGPIVLQIDGHTLMRWIDNKQGRQMALYGLGD